MKKTLSIIGTVLVIMMGVGAVTHFLLKASKDKEPEKESIENEEYDTDPFKASIARSNMDCPIPVAGGAGQLSSIEFEDDKIVYRIDYKPGFVNIDAYRNNPEAARDMMYLSLLCVNGQDSGGDMLAKELIKRDYGLKVNVSDGTASYSAELSPEYIKEMQEKVKSNPSEAFHDAMALKIETEANSFPTQIDEGMVMTGMALEGNNLVFNIIVDEDIYDIDAFALTSDEFGQALINEANAGDPELAALFDLCKVSHTGLIYRMIGNQTKRHGDLTITSDQIRRQHKTPPQLDIQ